MSTQARVQVGIVLILIPIHSGGNEQ